jgi:hypothetical protein
LSKIWSGVLASVLLPSAALAQAAPANWVQFVDPTERAFALDVPQGWVVKGGIKRFSEISVQPWFNATSPDGTVQIFIGDPQIPVFSVPKPNQAEGTQVPPVSAEFEPGVALNYRPGFEFAKLYGPKNLAAIGCTGAALTGTQSMPDLARFQYQLAVAHLQGIAVRGGYTAPQHEAGLATFTCQSGGKTMAAGVVADTSQPGAVGIWGVALVSGYLTSPDQAASALASLNRMLASRQPNPQWDEAMRQKLQESLTRQNQQSDQFMAQMNRQSQDFTNMLLANGDAQQAARTASHNAFMAQMDQQSATRNAQFQNYQAQRSLNSWNFDAHIRNGNLYRDTDTGTIFEVDH